jgi:hypothetical protein
MNVTQGTPFLKIGLPWAGAFLRFLTADNGCDRVFDGSFNSEFDAVPSEVDVV